MPRGQCHCGAIAYEMPTEVAYHAVCYCKDCCRHAGAPAVSWALVAQAALTVTGEPKVYAASEHARRHFCGDCGSGLFYTNDVVFPGMIDVKTATLDDPDSIPLQVQVQVADRIGWMAHAHDLPAFDRYPAAPEG